MAITTPLPTPELLTYETYLAEGEINKRYDIIDGVRIYTSAPSWLHQEILLNITEALRAYQRASGRGRTVIAPFDILIRRTPKLRSRQPDLLFLTNETLAKADASALPFPAAPELVVEILSDSERRSVVADKLADYCAIGVAEAWLVRPASRTVEVLSLTSDGPLSIANYEAAQTLQSLTFTDLTLPIADFFK